MEWNPLLARPASAFERCHPAVRGKSPLRDAPSTGAAPLIDLRKGTKCRRAVMQDDRRSRERRSRERKPQRFAVLRVPLFRLLAINLAAGMLLAVLLVGGLLALNPAGLRDLIFADRSPVTALGLLLFGFVVTLGSTAMGTAIMAMGEREADDEPRGPPRLVAQKPNRGVATAGRQR